MKPVGRNHDDNYINGRWRTATGRTSINVINPATEEIIARVACASNADVDSAVAAAKSAFPAFSHTSRAERIALLTKILSIYERRQDEFANVLSLEMGAPITLARGAQTWLGGAHLREAITGLERMALEEVRGTSVLVREPIGVAALITPWNWPINQVFTKTAGALAAGCTMVLKPSEIAPLNALLFAEIVHEAGAPPGVFNLVNGEGPTVGHALAAHPDVDVVSFTGSTRAGKLIAKAAAETVKRVHQELGGKSPNVILDDADLEAAVTTGVHNCFSNAGQSCSVSTRMLVPRQLHDRAASIAKDVAEAYVVGDPLAEATTMGPIVNAAQFAHVQRLIQAGISEGARLITGGTGLPTGLNRGYFTRPTVFADVKPGTSIEQQEIFGPVLSIVPYDSEEQAIEIANDTIYGLAAVVQSRDLTRARRVANQLRAGHVYLNHQADAYAAVPFGGYKQSGNGYEHGEWGIEAFQQIKAILGAS